MAMVRTVVWAAVAAGPLALAVSCAGPDPVVRIPKAAAAQPSGSRLLQADPSGYAEVAVALWLRSGNRQDPAAAAALLTMAPSVESPVWSKDVPKVERVTAVGTARLRNSTWSVTVGVQFAGGGVRYFAVPMTFDGGDRAAGSQPGLVVTSAPAEVAGPRRLKAPTSVYGSEVPTESPLAVTVGEFLAAYAGGSGSADRYLAPGVDLPSLVPAPYRQVRMDRLSADESGDGGVRKDGSTVRVQARVTARDAAGGLWPLAYALRLTARAGRWEVTGLESGSTATKPSPASAAVPSSAARSAGLPMTTVQEIR